MNNEEDKEYNVIEINKNPLITIVSEDFLYPGPNYRIFLVNFNVLKLSKYQYI